WLFETPQGLAGRLTYSTDILSAATASRLHQRLATMLEALRSDPMMAIGDVGMCAASDSESLRTWNDTATAPEAASTVHAMLREQCLRTPDRMALRFGEKSVTYA